MHVLSRHLTHDCIPIYYHSRCFGHRSECHSSWGHCRCVRNRCSRGRGRSSRGHGRCVQSRCSQGRGRCVRSAGLNADKNEFDVVLGEGSRKEVVYMIRNHFNMDGRDPSGRKVGLLDRFHYWCFMVDPFNHEWRSTFKLEPSFAELEKEMVEAYVPLDEDGSTETRDRILKDFQVSYLFFDSLYNSFTLTLTSAFRISTFRTKTG